MRDTIFFDLDGTLLYMNQDKHIEAFYNIMYENACDKTRKFILDSTIMNKSFGFMMSEQHKDMTNSDALLYSLENLTGLSKDVWNEYFERLYEEQYERLRCTVVKVETTNEVLCTALNKGYDLILATNPVFHKSGTMDRLKWADIDPGCFSYISFVDEMNYCKPSIKYYEQVLDKVNKSAERCFMVGNSVDEDMCAVELGFSGYLVTDCLIGKIEEASQCEKGTYLDLLDWAKKTSVSLKADYYIFGLGNMGEKYQGTRHNAGFDIVDTIANEYGVKFDIAKNKALCAKINVQGKDIILIKPQTYMNNSGLCVKSFLKKTKIDIKDIVVIYDDIDINKSAIRIKDSGSAGSHNGIRSIIYHIKRDDFKRIRVGIGRPKDMNDLIPFVIGKFDKSDYNIMYDCYKKVAKAAVEIFFDGISAVQSRYNYKGIN